MPRLQPDGDPSGPVRVATPRPAVAPVTARPADQAPALGRKDQTSEAPVPGVSVTGNVE